MSWIPGRALSCLGAGVLVAAATAAGHDAGFLVLDLDGDGLHLSDVFYPVAFDVDGDGEAEILSWTAERHNEAFLWLDSDGDGRVVGTELIGTVAGGGDDAFSALAAHDRPVTGGNGDGVFSPADATWSRLRLWVDWNHDARAAPEEIYTPADWDIVEIRLEHEEISAVDGSLNLHRRSGRFRAITPTHDVFGVVTEVWFDVLPGDRPDGSPEP